jgi:hypothetical protein
MEIYFARLPDTFRPNSRHIPHRGISINFNLAAKRYAFRTKLPSLDIVPRNLAIASSKISVESNQPARSATVSTAFK